MKKTIIIDKSELSEVLEEISKRQTKAKTFYNVKTEPYRGQKHPNEGELIKVIIG